MMIIICYHIGNSNYFNIFILTPFIVNYSDVNFRLKMQSNWLLSYGSISWLPDQNIKMEVSYNYSLSDVSTDFNFKSLINSTVAEVNSMHAIFKYNQADSFYKTDFSLKVRYIVLS